MSSDRRTNAHNALVEASWRDEMASIPLVFSPHWSTLRFFPVTFMTPPQKKKKPRMRSTAHFIREKNAFRPQPKQQVLTGCIVKKKQVDKESIDLWPF